MHACHDSDVTLSVWYSLVIGQGVKPLGVSVVSRLCLYPVTIAAVVYQYDSVSVHVCSLWDTHLTMQIIMACIRVADNGLVDNQTEGTIRASKNTRRYGERGHAVGV